MLLPRGAARLRDDLGSFLKQRRQGKLGDERFGTQAEVAARIGITRQTLSDIERGAKWPGPVTLDALLDLLDLGWEHVAHPVASGRRPLLVVEDMPGGGRLVAVSKSDAPCRHRVLIEGYQGRLLLSLGEALRAERKQRRLTLVEAALRAGVSAALLSHLERGQLSRSALFRFDKGEPDELGRPKLVVLNPWLARLLGDDDDL